MPSSPSRIGINIVILSLLSMAILLSAGNSVLGKNATEVITIESPGCQKCAAMERTLSEINKQNPLNITKYYYYTKEGHKIIKERNVTDVPAVIIGSYVINYRDYEGDNVKMERLIRKALENQTTMETPLNISNSQSRAGNPPSLNLEEISLYTVSAVLGAGLVAGFNPCLLGILVFLAASVLASSGRRRELVMMVIFFSLGIFTMYFLFGLGMQHLLQTEAITSAFRYVLAAFLVFIGLVQILDAVRLDRGKPSLFRTDWALKYFQAGVDRGKFTSYFLAGALFSLVKAPCVGAVYLAILDLLSAKSYLVGATYLFFFNFGVILPIIVVGGLMAMGTSPDRVDQFRKDHRVGMRLVTGLMLLALAPLIYWQYI